MCIVPFSLTLCELQRKIYVVAFVFIKIGYYFLTGLCSCVTARMAGNNMFSGNFLLSELLHSNFLKVNIYSKLWLHR